MEQLIVSYSRQYKADRLSILMIAVPLLNNQTHFLCVETSGDIPCFNNILLQLFSLCICVRVWENT